ncbi:efflux RND transporter periplasmic adaptor subunit [Halosquirtibacter xylanolyticus]|uniref:efflux RND transporter periplasmic adaptor subunit n=1 Tax=Halosquirtibacter xylanolyticus TaxID=3374599 RepID=UPI003747A943|nr:efflux RND transporter periplasmic adaptor subunit [Prolixibacteraceae bacterium]
MRYLFVLLVSGALFFSCDNTVKKSQQPLPNIELGHPVVEDITVYHDFSGYTDAKAAVDIFPRVQGLLEKIYFKPGAFVHKGERLFGLEREPYYSKMKEASSAVASSKAQLELSRMVLDRLVKAKRSNAVSEVQLLTAQTQVDLDRASYEQNKALLSVSKTNYSYTTIVSPIDGYISDYYVDRGNLMDPNGKQKLASIVGDRLMDIYFTVNSSELQLLRKELESDLGLSVQIYDESGEMMLVEAKVKYFDPSVDLSTGNITLKATVDNEDRKLLAGTYLRIKVPLQKIEKALLVPQSAISRDQEGAYVYEVIDSKSVVKRIELMGSYEKMSIVKGGLKHDDQIVIKGTNKLHHMMVVE